MMTFVILSGVKYDSMTQRPQHIANSLAQKGYTVIYIHDIKEIEFKEYDQIVFCNVTSVFREIKKNLFLCDLFTTGTEKENDIFKINILQQIERYYGSENTVFLVEFPSFTKYVSMLSENTTVIYDCIDDWESFVNDLDFGLKKEIIYQEKKLASICDIVAASSKKLYTNMYPFNSNIYYFPNGVTPEHYCCSTNNVPNDIKGIPKPIVFFMGAISGWVDFDLIDYIISERPNYSYVFVGPSFTNNLLPKKENMYFLGKKNYTELPGYIRQAKVGIIPFRVNRLTAAVTPLKFFEYLSAGLPTVTTMMPDLINIPGSSIANNYYDFLAKIDGYMNMGEEEYNLVSKDAMNSSINYRWDYLVDRFIQYVNDCRCGDKIQSKRDFVIQTIEHYNKNNNEKNHIVENELLIMYNLIGEYTKAYHIGLNLIDAGFDLDYNQLALASYEIGDIENSIRFMNMYLNHNKELKDLMYDKYLSSLLMIEQSDKILKAVLLKLCGRQIEGIAFLDELIDINPRIKDLYGLLADMYWDIGEDSLAVNVILHATEIWDASAVIQSLAPHCLDRLIDLFMDKGQYELAEKVALELLSFGLKAKAEAKLGSIYFRQHYNSYGEEEIMKMAANKVRVTTGFEEDRKLWDFIWSKEVDDWDNLSEVIYSTLVEEMGSLKGKKILEAGSGSGKISLRLALEGADVTLFDYSEMALIQAKKLFNRYGLEPKLVQADLRKILPFEDDSFDIVFNAGVMEHFTENQQIQIIKEFGRIGVELHTFNPNSNSFFYQLGKWVAEEANIWPYGKEYPVNSMKNIFEKAGFNLEIEYSVGFESSLYFLDYIKDGKTIREIIQMFIKSLNPATRDMFMDRLGRYLIYSKGIRKT